MCRKQQHRSSLILIGCMCVCVCGSVSPCANTLWKQCFSNNLAYWFIGGRRAVGGKPNKAKKGRAYEKKSNDNRWWNFCWFSSTSPLTYCCTSVPPSYSHEHIDTTYCSFARELACNRLAFCPAKVLMSEQCTNNCWSSKSLTKIIWINSHKHVCNIFLHDLPSLVRNVTPCRSG